MWEQSGFTDGERSLSLHANGDWTYRDSPAGDLYLAMRDDMVLNYDDRVLRIDATWCRLVGDEVWGARRTVEFSVGHEWAWMWQPFSLRPRAGPAARLVRAAKM